jgi:hypothetical protein
MGTVSLNLREQAHLNVVMVAAAKLTCLFPFRIAARTLRVDGNLAVPTLRMCAQKKKYDPFVALGQWNKGSTFGSPTIK